MKTDRNGLPELEARLGSSPAHATGTQRRFGRARVVAVISVLLLAAVIMNRQTVLRWLFTGGLGWLTGDRISVRSLHVGLGESAVRDLRITTAGGDPLLAADGVRVRYSLRDALTGAQRRFGILAVAFDHPVLSLIRHADGRFRLGPASTGAGKQSGAGAAAAAWNCSVTVRGGMVRLIDLAPVSADLQEQRIDRLVLDAEIHSAGLSTLRGGATLVGRQTNGGPLRRWPLAVRASVDVPREFAIGRIVAPELPLRGVVGYLQHSAAVRVDDGVLRAMSVAVYALNIAPDRGPDIRLGGTAELRRGRLKIAALALPVRDLRGRLRLVDDGLWATRLDATLAGIPLIARGAAFNLHRPTLRLGVRANGDLRDLRQAFAFSKLQPVSGRVLVQTLLEAPVADLLIRSSLSVARGSYGKLPLTGLAGRIDYHAGALVLDGLHAGYGPAAIGVGGRFVFGRPVLNAAIVAVAQAAAVKLPFAENIAPEARIDALAMITGSRAGYRVRGALGVRSADANGQGAFAIDERGVGEFGPLAVTRRDGSSLQGVFRLERTRSQSAAWIAAHAFRIALPPAGARLPGLQLPAFPPIAGVLDGEVVGGGKPGAFALAGRLSGTKLRAGNVVLGSGGTQLAGTLTDLRLAAIQLAGGLGTFAGSAAAHAGQFAMQGAYSGSLDRLVPLTGNLQAHGGLRGIVRAVLAAGDVVVQSPRAILQAGRVRGVAVDETSGTIAVRKSRFHLIAGSAAIGGQHAVAVESQGRVALSAPEIPSSALLETGLPLDRGNVSAYGIADLSGKTAFDGTLAIRAGRTHGYPVAGDAQIDLDGARARIFGATGSFGTTYGTFGGRIDGIGEHALRYALRGRVPLGDIAALRRDLGLPLRHLAGSFTADFDVSGAGARPRVAGRMTAPEGSFNGLGFRAAAARVELAADHIGARDGTISVGSTNVALSASRGVDGMSVAVRSPAVDLADFNDYFDAGDTLAGKGPVSLSLRADGLRVVSAGQLSMRGVRYRALPIGAVQATWLTHGATIAGRATVRGPAGSLRGSVAASAVRGPLQTALGAARYDARVQFERVDVATWLPAAGLNVPIAGKVDADIRVDGRFPRLMLATDMALAEGSVAGIAVRTAHVRASGAGTRITVAASDADLGFARFSGNGRLGLAAGDPLAFDVRVATDDVGRAVQAFVPAARDRQVSGTLEADVRVTGTRGAPKIAGGFDLEAARYAGFAVPRAIGSLAMQGPALELRDAEVEFTHGQAFVAGSLPLLVQPLRFGPSHAPLSFDVTARGVDLSQFEPLLPAGTSLGGTVDGRFGVEGFVDRPRLFGSLAIADGSYASALERAPFEHVRGNIAFAGPRIALQALHADVGGGTLDGNGTIDLPLGERSRPQYVATIAAHAAKLDFPAFGRGIVDGSVELTGGSAQPVVAGEVTIRSGVIPVSAVYRTDPAGGATVPGPGPALNPALQLKLIAADNVRVRNSIVDIGVAGAVDVAGTLRSPALSGGFTATDGTISSYNHIFRIVNAAVSFNPADGVIPTIDAQAVSRVSNPDPDPSRNIAGSATIVVTVSGTADSNNLQVTYSSEPAYSQAQIIGLLLDVPALLGAVNFNLNGPGAPLLRGAPGETNALLPPGVTPEQVSAISFNQEVFSLLNGQFTQRALGPLERAAQKILGLSDLEFTVDYGGGIGYSLRRQLGKRDFYAFLSQTVTYPERINVGFELQPKPFETVNFSYYAQNGVTSLITNQTPGAGFLSATRRFTSVQPLGNRSGFSLNLNRRF